MATILQKMQKPITLIIKRKGEKVTKLKLPGATALLSNLRPGTRMEQQITAAIARSIHKKKAL